MAPIYIDAGWFPFLGTHGDNFRRISSHDGRNFSESNQQSNMSIRLLSVTEIFFYC